MSRSRERRMLAVGAAVMVGLVLVGVVSAALYTRSACGDVEPDPVAVGGSHVDVEVLLSEAFGELDADQRGAVGAAVAELAERLGPVVSAVDVRDADRLASIPGGALALGAASTSIEAGEPRTAAEFAPPTLVVGDGASLYSLALANQLTGQVDAVLPVDPRLAESGPCLDAALVNIPFAFHLDAGGGQLLLLRAGEDADDPRLELRDPEGSRWSAALELTVAPPGVLGERLTGRLGDDLAVTAQRVTEDELPAVAAVARSDGAARWTLPASALPDPGDGPRWVSVHVVGDDLVLVGVAPEEQRRSETLVGIDAAGGSVRWVGDWPVDLVAAGSVDADLVLVHREGDELVVSSIDPSTGGLERLASAAESGRTSGATAATDGARVTALGGAGALLHGSEGARLVPTGLDTLDVASDEQGLTTVLLGSGPRSVAVTFGG